jgi:hypothetical protein
MTCLLRLLLAICLAATALPSPAAGGVDDAVRATQDGDVPPCHTPDPAPPAQADQHAGGHGCCGGDAGACDCGCGCLHVAGLPIPMPSLAAGVAPPGPPASAGDAGPVPRLPQPIRPPIA